MTRTLRLMKHQDNPPGRRVMMHSHDSFGLGHLRRSLTLAGELVSKEAGTTVLITTGSPCATHFELPPGVEIVKLPSVTKDEAGAYTPRTLGTMDLVDQLRRTILMQVFEAFRPELLIVDHQPVGLRGELIDVLRRCREMGTRTILGMRDVIDEPERVAREWGTPLVREALGSLYDRVCVYGSPEIFDPRIQYPIPPELGQRVEFVGYVVREGTRREPEDRDEFRPQVLITMGGGEDGEHLVMTYLAGLERQPVTWDSNFVLGPLMNRARARKIKRAARRMTGVSVRGFYSDLPRLLSESDAVVSMAGYNTVCEILSTRVSSVLLPRAHPRKEQLIRAQRLEELGLARAVVDPTPAT